MFKFMIRIEDEDRVFSVSEEEWNKRVHEYFDQGVIRPLLERSLNIELFMVSMKRVGDEVLPCFTYRSMKTPNRLILDAFDFFIKGIRYITEDNQIEDRLPLEIKPSMVFEQPSIDDYWLEVFYITVLHLDDLYETGMVTEEINQYVKEEYQPIIDFLYWLYYTETQQGA